MELQFYSSMPCINTQLAGHVMFTLILGGIIIPLLLHLKQYRSSDKLPPGNLGLPFLGETLQFLWALKASKTQQFFDHREQKFGHVYKTSLGGHTTVVFCGPSGNKLLLSNEDKLVVLSWPSPFMKLLGRDSLLGKSGEEHRIVRAALASFFSPSALQNYISKISSEIKNHIDEKWKPRDQVKVLPLVGELMFSNTCNLFFNLGDKNLQERLHTLLETVIVGSSSLLPVDFPGTSFNTAMKARLEIDRNLSSLIDERRSDLSSGTASPDGDLLSALLTFKDERGNSLSEKEIIDNFSMLLHAGYHTIISPLSIMFKLLSSNPDCYNKLTQEHLRIAANKEEGEELSWKDLKEMKYTWQCAQETLRMYPPAFGSFRKAIKEFEYEGYRIPKGCKLLCTTSTHMKEEYFSEPEKFRPSRFDEEEVNLKPYTYIAFGGGLRKCPGWELSRVKIVVFMHHFVKSFSGYSLIDPNEKISGNPVPPLPINGLPIQLLRRV